jgi:hypothetical protein
MNLNKGNGSGQFYWFHGIVEDISDPLKLGRVRVRCIGYHNEDANILPVENLPWSYQIMPVTSAAYKGIGRSPTGLKIGSWVIGFFRDGEVGQDPIIMGSIPSITDGVPDIPVSAQTNYPNRHVIRTESGHQFQWDDTPGSETISMTHKKGSVFSIDKDGNILVDATAGGGSVTIKGTRIDLNP